MKDIYIVLTNTGTMLSSIIKYWTKNRNTHVSIALDRDLVELYSFGRVNPYNAFIGGFVKEGIDIGTFKRFSNTTTQIYSLSVTEEQYRKIQETIWDVQNNRETYKFNIIGLLFAGFNKNRTRKNKFYCAEFVKYVLYSSRIDAVNYSLIIKPEDFKKISNLRLIYQGLLKEYNMKKVNKLQYL